MKKIIFILVFAFSSVFAIAEENLESQLESLKLPENVAPQGINKERLYSFQSRLLSLKGKHEINLGGANNFTPDDHLTSRRINANYRYHINNRFSVGAEAFKVFNELNSSGKNLMYENGVVPATDYQKMGFTIGGLYNLFYGKFRFGLEKAHYFDHYVGASIGQLSLANGSTIMANLETGLAFWISDWGSFRVGIKDELYQEDRGTGKRFTHNFLGQISIGYLFGGASS